MGSKKKKAKAHTATSPFDQLQTYNVNLDGFVNSGATNNGKTIDVTSGLDSPLKGLFNNAAEGTTNQTEFLGLNPYQQLEQLDAGNNQFYNAQSYLNEKALDDALGAVRADNARRGISDSTTAGAMQGKVISDHVLRDLTTRNESLAAQNSVSLQNNAALQNTLNSLYNYQLGGANAAQQGLTQGLLDKSQTARQNAQLKTQVSMQNAQNSGSNIWGSVGKLAGAAAGLALAPVTGGGSLSMMGLGSGLGGAAGSIFGGGSSGGSGGIGGSLGSIALPSSNYTPQQYNQPIIPTFTPTVGGVPIQSTSTLGGYFN